MAQALPRAVVAALRGGSGKTTITLGIIQALRDRGVKLAPFKKGPDYIDPFWHAEAAGAPCRNLDPYLMGRDQLERSFGFHAAGFQAAVIEGNRGLFDGMDAGGSYSTAELAKWLKAPVVLVVDCSMASRTIAATVLGCQQFDREVNLAGVVLNPVANSRHESVIRKAIANSTGIKVLGAVPRLKLDLPQRHMGLVPPQEHQGVARALGQIGRSVAQYVDVEALWSIMTAAPPWSIDAPPKGLVPPEPKPLKGPAIGVIKDDAFGFYYPENLEALANFGARLKFCSALAHGELPRVDALYIGGGFPETFAQSLAENQSFRLAVKKAAEAGLPIYAECGGLMYLGRNLVVEGNAYPMCGVFPVDFVMEKAPQGHGYSLCQVTAENPFLPVGYQFRAHEFHYSRPVMQKGEPVKFAYQVLRGHGMQGEGCGLVRYNVLGTYHHMHCLGAARWAPGLLAAAA